MPHLTTLTQLIAFGLFGGINPVAEIKTTLSEQDWKLIFDLSRQQAVTALLYDAILMLPKEQRPPRSVLFHFMSMTQTIEHDNRSRHDALRAFQSQIMQPMEIPCVVVKGSSLAALYPDPIHRECGDNDLYTGENTQSLGTRLRSLGIAVDNKDPRHASFTFHDVDFEAHSYLLYHNDDPKWNFIPLGTTGLFHLPIEEEAFFLAKHIEHHAVFFHEPVRLRDLVDWSILLRNPDFDMQHFRELKKGSDVEHFAELMSHYINCIFGLGLDYSLPKGLAADDFDKLYMHCPQRHPLAIIRVARRGGKYLRYAHKYRILYGQSMFRRFYLNNIYIAIRNRFTTKQNNLEK